MDKVFMDRIIDLKLEKEIPSMQRPSLVLAYIGDAVYEVMVRTFLLNKKETKVNLIHKAATNFVKAKAQSLAMGKIEEYITEEEEAVYKRGRNTKSATVPKNADIVDYRRATGFEALIGYLYLEKRYDRLHEIVKIAIETIEESL